MNVEIIDDEMQLQFNGVTICMSVAEGMALAALIEDSFKIAAPPDRFSPINNIVDPWHVSHAVKNKGASHA